MKATQLFFFGCLIVILGIVPIWFRRWIDDALFQPFLGVDACLWLSGSIVILGALILFRFNFKRFRWGIIYLLLLADVYPLVYAFVRKDFYHSTTRFESSLKHYRTEIEQKLLSAMRKSFSSTHPTDETRRVAGWSIDEIESVLHLRVNDNEIDPEVSFDLDVEVEKIPPNEPGEMYRGLVKWRQIVRFNLGERNAIGGSDTSAPFPVICDQGGGYAFDEEHGHIFAVSELPLDALNRAIFFPPEIVGFEDTEAVKQILTMPTSLAVEIEAWLHGLQGDPTGLPDEFERLLYMSATSMTTIGFGDIVPTTTVSRLLVTSQAVFGVILIGLFLNDLSKKGP